MFPGNAADATRADYRQQSGPLPQGISTASDERKSGRISASSFLLG